MAVEITWLGHSGFLFRSSAHAVVIDPFLSGNPLAKHTPDDISCDAILLSHGHPDHIGDTVAIGKKCNAPVYAPFETAVWAQEQGLEAVDMNPGGRVQTNWGWVAFVQAFHSSSYEGRYMGCACGVVFSIGGTTVYHAGDTGLFSDMKLIGELFRPDIACIPIGGRYTMTPELATRAAEWISPRIAIPMHYRTFPILTRDASGFQPRGVEVKTPEPGETFAL